MLLGLAFFGPGRASDRLKPRRSSPELSCSVLVWIDDQDLEGILVSVACMLRKRNARAASPSPFCMLADLFCDGQRIDGQRIKGTGAQQSDLSGKLEMSRKRE
jgi:hypothetical protein